MRVATVRSAANGHGTRILAVDAARGVAMLFACLSHFGGWLQPAFPRAAAVLRTIGMIATPAFMMLSGAMVSLRAGPAGLISRSLKVDLVDRGLFLVTVAHLLISLSEVHDGADFRHQIIQLNSVDVIGLGCILMAVSGNRILAWTRLTVLVSGAVMACAWLVVILWQPMTGPTKVVAELLVGQLNGAQVIDYACPLAQYLALYLIGTALGRALALARVAGDIRPYGRRLITLGGGLLLSAVALRLMLKLDGHFPGMVAGPVIRATLSLSEKLPPSPGYLLFFGGEAFAMVGVVILLSYRRAWRPVLDWLAVIGKASLFFFVLQYFVIQTFPYLLGLRPTALGLLLFPADIMLLWAAARIWTNYHGNRWLVYGLQRWQSR